MAKISFLKSQKIELRRYWLGCLVEFASGSIYLSILATLVTSYLYQRGTIFLGPKKVMAYIYLNPTAIVIISFLSGLEKINLFMLLGILISALATFILLYKNKNIQTKVYILKQQF